MPHMTFADQSRLALWATVFNDQENARTDAELYYDSSFDDMWEDPDAAYERHLENLGWQAAELDRLMEDRAGVVQFEDAFAEAMRGA